MFRVILVVTAAILLSGCAGSPVGDALAGPEKLAAQDDSYCQSIGLQFGTPDYANCRLLATQQREARHAHRLGIAAQGLAVAAQASQPVTPSTTTCQRVGLQTVCNTR